MRSAETEYAIEPDREAGSVAHGPDRGDDAGHERLAMGRVVPDRERLPPAAEQHLLMRQQAPQPNAVHPYAVDVGAPSAWEL